MAHENKQEVLKGQHFHEKGVYFPAVYEKQEYPKWVGGVVVKNADEEAAVKKEVKKEVKAEEAKK